MSDGRLKRQVRSRSVTNVPAARSPTPRRGWPVSAPSNWSESRRSSRWQTSLARSSVSSQRPAKTTVRVARLISLAAAALLLLLPAAVLARVGFSAPRNFAVGSAPGSVAIGNFNADSDPDLAVANTNSNNVSILFGGAGESFGAPTNYAVGSGPSSVALGDFNADSYPDLAAANSGSNNVSILLGGAGGSFGAPTNFAGGASGSVAVGDFNADSDPDLAVTSFYSDNVSVLLGGAGGSFGGPTYFAVGSEPDAGAVGDFNADSEPDLAVANSGSSNVSILLNDPTPPETTITKGQSGKTTDRTPTFKFKSSERGSTFKYRVDNKPFRRCHSPSTLKQLDLGGHTFKVRATDSAGNTDPTSARRRFKVVR